MDFSGFSADALLEIEKIRHTEIIRKKAEDDRRRLEQQQKEKMLKRKATDEGKRLLEKRVSVLALEFCRSCPILSFLKFLSI